MEYRFCGYFRFDIRLDIDGIADIWIFYIIALRMFKLATR